VLQELKRYLTSPPVMVALEPSEPLLLYITATAEAVSMVLVIEGLDPHNPHALGNPPPMVQGLRTRNLRRNQGLWG
jgi:hypothetical protein